jgi:hypothetical protein
MLFAIAGLALVTGCSSTGPSNGTNAYAAPAQRSDDGFVPPFRGESRDQILAKYGDPDQTFQSSQTVETWVYFLGKAKQFIPFYGPWAERRVLVIHFDQNGVISWESHSNRPD